jgi:KUP system potassium uptake protein
MEHRAAAPDVIVQVNSAAVAAVDERISTCQITEEEGGIVGHEQVPVGCLARRTFSQSYRTRPRNPLVRTNDMHHPSNPTKKNTTISYSFIDNVCVTAPPQEFTGWQLALLAYQSLGVVYGDIGTSPLYTFSSFALPDPGTADILGILSLILWTLTLVSLVKYVFIVLHADDHGEGTTLALKKMLLLLFVDLLTIMHAHGRLIVDLNLVNSCTALKMRLI